MTEQLTRDEAIALFDSGDYDSWNDEEVAEFQLFHDRMCVSFSRFHGAIEVVLGHPIFTHEFANIERLRAEWRSKKGLGSLFLRKETLRRKAS